FSPWPTKAALPVSGSTTLMSYGPAASAAVESVVTTAAAVKKAAHGIPIKRAIFIWSSLSKASRSAELCQLSKTPPPEYSASARLVDVARSRKSHVADEKRPARPGDVSASPFTHLFGLPSMLQPNGRTHSHDAHPRL